MTEAQLAALVTAGAGGFLAFLRWAVGLWAAVRREDIAAAAAAAKQAREDSQSAAALAREDSRQMAAMSREDNQRMVAALLEQARSNATLVASNAIIADKLDALTAKLDSVGSDELRPRRTGAHRTATQPLGHAIRARAHDDTED